MVGLEVDEIYLGLGWVCMCGEVVGVFSPVSYKGLYQG